MGAELPSFSSSQDDTREKLLNAARAQFAQRGFYGASIAQIAGEVGLTKQALLYHFKRKEDLYAEALKGIAVRLLAAMQSGHDESRPPAEQFEAMMKAIFCSARENPLDTKVLMREVLDDQRQDTPPSEWFLKTVLDELVGVLEQVPGLSTLSHAEKLSRVYLAISAIQFFVASKSVLNRFYGDAEFAHIRDAYPEALREQVRRLLDPPAA